MGDVLEIIALALLAMFFPALLAVVLIALRSRRPQLLLASFYAGGLLSATTVGLVIVFSLQGASVDSSSSNGLDPVFYVILGVISSDRGHGSSATASSSSRRRRAARRRQTARNPTV